MKNLLTSEKVVNLKMKIDGFQICEEFFTVNLYLHLFRVFYFTSIEKCWIGIIDEC